MERAVERAVAKIPRLASAPSECYFASLRGHAALLRGDFDAARETFDRALRRAAAGGELAPDLLVGLELGSAWALLQAGQPDAAEQALERTRARLDDPDRVCPLQRAWCVALARRLEARLGD